MKGKMRYFAIIRRELALLLCIAIAVTSVDVYAMDKEAYSIAEINENVSDSDQYEYAVLPENDSIPDDAVSSAGSDTERIMSAMKTYCDAVNNAFLNTGTEENPIEFLSMRGMLLRGLPAASQICNGTISILEVIGVVKNPTQEGFEKIEGAIKNLSDRMDALEIEVKEVSEQIKDLTRFEKEKARQDNASKYLAAWGKFKTDYVDDMEKISAEIQAFSRQGIKEWWGRNDQKSISVIYAKPEKMPGETAEHDPCVAFSKDSYGRNELVAKSDAGEDVIADMSFIIPAEYIPDTSSVDFNVNSYQEVFCNETDGLATKKIYDAIQANKVSANSAFYASWTSIATDAEKMKKASEYATDLLKTIMYQENCRIMSAENVRVSDYIVRYKQYCDNIQAKQSGVDAFIQNLYMTHGFEGQVKKDIEDFCTAQIADVGTYGLLIMMAAAQCNLVTDLEHDKVNSAWAETIEALDNKKKNSLTGYDDFCYIAGKRLSYEKGTVANKLSIKNHSGNRYEDYYDGGFKFGDKIEDEELKGTVTRDQMLSREHVQILYDQFLKNSDGAVTFKSYISANMLNVPNSGDLKIATDIADNPTSFNLDKGLKLNAKNMLGSYTKDGTEYAINQKTKLKNKYFRIHDELKYDEVDLNDVPNGITNDKTLVARAVYGESHGYWFEDEAHIFYSSDVAVYNQDDEFDGKYSTESKLLTKDFNYIKKTDVAALKNLGIDNVFATEDVSDDVNADGDNMLDDSSPLLVFGAPYVLYGESSDEEEIPYSKADWSTLKWDNLRLFTDDSKYGDRIDKEIDAEIAYANAEGVAVSLTAEEKNNLTNEMKAQLAEIENVLKNNSTIAYVNAFNIDGNDDLENELATKVLPSTYFRGGKCIIPPENMTVVVEYEPFIFVKYMEIDGRIHPFINPGYKIVPALVAWDSQIEDFEGYQISEEVYSDLNMIMDINVPVGDLVKGTCIGVSCYSPENKHKQDEEKYLEIYGEGNHRYVTLSAKKDMLYELRVDETGDRTGVWLDKVPDQKYTGKAIKPEIKLYDGDKTLKKGKDYTVRYKDNTKPGTATVIVTGKGNYNDVLTDTFKIEAPDIMESSFYTESVIAIKEKSNSQKPAVKLLWNNKALSKNYYKCDYFKADANFKKSGEALGSVKEAGNYIIELTGRNGFTGSRTVKLIVANKDQKLASTLRVDMVKSVAYNDGNRIEPKVVVYDGSHKLSNEEYYVNYSNNTDIGTATAVITGKGKYVGTKRATFKITGKDIKKAVVSGIPSSVTYTGNKISLNEIKLTYDGVELLTSDYEIEYKNNVKAGKATVAIKGIKGFTGTIKKNFRILPYDVADESEKLNVIISTNTIEHSKGGAKPSVSVNFIQADGTKALLEAGSDYTLSYTRNKAVGDDKNVATAPTVKVKFKGNYKGTVSKTFTIVTKDMSKVKVAVKDKVYKNKKGAYLSNVTVYDTDGKKLVKNKDYDADIEYYSGGTKLTKDSVVDAGTEVEVVVKAKKDGNYIGESRARYRVASASLDKAKVTLKFAGKQYTGNPVTISGNEIKVKIDTNTELTEGVDYVILADGYSNNENVGKATATIRGIGKYCGTKPIKFSIRARKIVK